MSTNQKSRHSNKQGRHNNKQQSRGRNQGGRGGGRKGPSNYQSSHQPLTATKQVDSHGPAGKLRGNVKQLYDQYKELATDCRTKDRTTSEAFSQYAHHYYSLYSEFSAAEAAKEAERDKEKLIKQQEAAESQSNVVPILEDEEGSVETPKDIFAQEADAPVAEKKRRPEQSRPPKKPEVKSPEVKKPEAKEDAVEAAAEFQLDLEEPVKKPRRKPAPRAKKKIAEDVPE